MTRIVGGLARGRQLKVPLDGTRPTSDRAREAVFSALESQLGGFAGLHVLDLYAGSGALGLEALSRGAARVDFVESDRAAVAALRVNVSAVTLPGAVVHQVAVERWVLQRGQRPAADLVLADPPYASTNNQIHRVLDELAATGGLVAGCVLVLERPTRGAAFDWPDGFVGVRSRRYGEATMWFGRFDSVAAC